MAQSPLEFRPERRYEQGWNAINELIRSDRTWSGYERNLFYANNRDGTFSDISAVAGLDFLEDGNRNRRIRRRRSPTGASQVVALSNLFGGLPIQLNED